MEITHKSKLPIKRKTTPDPNPPLKFHRIWTEPDEIRFLQGLLDSDNLSFPRDLQIFYDRFSNTMSQPYTKSQLSEKLRRLRKKFRVISTRLSKGMDFSHLSLHDRAIFELAGRLWGPDYAATSPFNGARNVGGFAAVGSNNSYNNANNGNGEGLVGITVDFAPTIPVVATGFEFNDDDECDGDDYIDDIKLEFDEGIINGDEIEGGVVIGEGNGEDAVKLSEVNVEIEVAGEGKCDFGGETVESKVGEVAVKAVMGMFEQSIEDLRGKVEQGRVGGTGGTLNVNVAVDGFHVRWKRQRIEELDVLGKRMSSFFQLLDLLKLTSVHYWDCKSLSNRNMWCFPYRS